MMLLHYGVDAFGACKAPAGRQGLDVTGLSQRPFGLRVDEFLLAEPAEFLLRMVLIESDNVLERVDRRVRAESGKIRVHVGFHFVSQNLKFGRLKLRWLWHLDRVDQLSSVVRQHLEREFHQLVNRRMESKKVPSYANPCDSQSI